MSGALGLFAGYGIELEYMIVDAATLAVKPVADALLAAEAGAAVNELTRGAIGWSNELALHVIELKTAAPVPAFAGVADAFQRDLARMEALLAPLGARLMPTGMHPWMKPLKEARLWPHEYGPIYQAYHRIFNCRGHGWSNLQSSHLNLPFDGDAEFARLHAAVRVLLPLLPALAAASPVVEGAVTEFVDNRLEFYRHNQKAVPAVAGQVIPEPIDGIADYHARILQPLYRAIAPHDPEGILQEEWLNSRGAIARFERSAIEIRLLDTQECPRLDLALHELIAAVLRALCHGPWRGPRRHNGFATPRLAALLLGAIRDGEAAAVEEDYAALFGAPAAARTAGDLWAHLFQALRGDLTPGAAEAIALLLEEGCLARRIRRGLGPAPEFEDLRSVYGRLCDCLREGEFYVP